MALRTGKILRYFLIFLCLFIGIGAVGGGMNFLSDPTGNSMGIAGLVVCLQTLPLADLLFQDYYFCGWALLLVMAVPNLAAAIFLLLKKNIGTLLATIMGVVLLCWIMVQFIIFPMNFMSISFFILALVQTACGLALLRLQKNTKKY